VQARCRGGWGGRVPCGRKEFDVDVWEEGEGGGLDLVGTIRRVVHELNEGKSKSVRGRKDVSCKEILFFN
jgi:hypothetical protein